MLSSKYIKISFVEDYNKSFDLLSKKLEFKIL